MPVNDVVGSDYNADSKMTTIHADKTAMSPRFVVDLTLLFLYGFHPWFDDNISPEFVCVVRVLSIPFGPLLAFVEPRFPAPLPLPPPLPFAPDARPFGPCVNTT